MISGGVVAAALVLSLASVAAVVWAWRREEARAQAQRDERLAELERVRKEQGL